MGELLQLLEHLVLHGPARNPTELERLLGLIEQARERFEGQPVTGAGPVPPAPVTQVT